MAMIPIAKVCPVNSKSLSPQQNERLREELRRIVDVEFKGNKTHAGKALGISQSYVTEILAGRRGFGQTVLNAMADHTGRSMDELSGRAPARATGEVRIEYDERYPNLARAIAFMHGLVSDLAVARVRTMALKSDQDMTQKEWADELEAEERRIKRERTDPAATDAEKARSRARTEDDAAELKARQDAARAARRKRTE